MPKTTIKLTLYLVDVLILIASFLFFIWLKPSSINTYLPQFWLPFVIFLAIWMLFSVIGRKFFIISKPLKKAVSSALNINLVTAAFIFLLIYLFDLVHLSRLVVLGTMGLATVLELILIYLVNQIMHAHPIQAEQLSNPKEELELHDPLVDFSQSQLCQDSVRSFLEKEASLNSNIKEFLVKNIPTDKIENSTFRLFNTATVFNIASIVPNTLLLLVNLHKINDIKRINRYFIKVNYRLQAGGYFVGQVETIKVRFQKIMARYPVGFNYLAYGIDFIFKRVIPKIPLLKQCYFALTKGRNRSISKTEVLGRLYYCGFRVEALEEIDNKLVFAARKVNLPLRYQEPSYGPFIKLRRVGKDGELINVYKFRTMHPYSEFLQEYIYENYNLDKSGKFKNDFRITTWGKVFRRLWIDELPQLINWLQGDLRIFGVRAISQHYFSLYPEEVQEMRIKHKPGLVPPYYTDLPTEFEEIVESEKRYLLQKQEHPILTDIKYFCKAWWNIIFKGARSK
jgi:lipopolysaccharide/colanic/teichoic acid biosynthesis glycosyltransferase